MPAFRIRGNAHLITWSDVDADTSHIDILDAVLSYSAVKRCIIARELHENGAPHFHLYVEWETKLDRSVTTQLDVNGKHPNIKAKQWPRERKAAADYVQKDDDYIVYPEPDSFEDEPTMEGPVDENGNLDLMALCEKTRTRGLWINECHARGIQAAIMNEVWRLVKGPVSNVFTADDYPGWDGLVLDPVLTELVFDPETHRSLVISGPSGAGKTTWGILHMPRPLIVVSHQDELKRGYIPGFHKSIIFDDMDFSHWPRVSQIHLLDWDLSRSIHCRNTNAYIDKCTYKLFTCNPQSFPFMRNDDAIDRRMSVVELE